MKKKIYFILSDSLLWKQISCRRIDVNMKYIFQFHASSVSVWVQINTLLTQNGWSHFTIYCGFRFLDWTNWRGDRGVLCLLSKMEEVREVCYCDGCMVTTNSLTQTKSESGRKEEEWDTEQEMKNGDQEWRNRDRAKMNLLWRVCQAETRLCRMVSAGDRKVDGKPD